LGDIKLSSQRPDVIIDFVEVYLRLITERTYAGAEICRTLRPPILLWLPLRTEARLKRRLVSLDLVVATRLLPFATPHYAQSTGILDKVVHFGGRLRACPLSGPIWLMPVICWSMILFSMYSSISSARRRSCRCASGSIVDLVAQLQQLLGVGDLVFHNFLFGLLAGQRPVFTRQVSVGDAEDEFRDVTDDPARSEQIDPTRAGIVDGTYSTPQNVGDPLS
jgi:hypothetical protein